jgi:ABC-type multidrug transport system fused ATPase/permease subunit
LRAFGELLNRSYAEIEKDGAQNYSYMINKNCQDVKPLAGTTIPTIIENLTTLIVGLFIAFYFSWEITLISLVIMPLILLSSKMLMSFNHGMQNITDSTHRRTH